MSVKKTMRIGFVNFAYPPPPEIQDPVDKLLWQMEEAHSLGCRAMHPLVPRLPTGGEGMERVIAKMREYDIEFDIQSPRAIFEMAGPNAESAKKELLETFELARRYGSRIIRCGFGRNNTATTRWFRTPGFHARELLDPIAASLKAAAPLFEDNGMLFALENHCDFTGKEIAYVIEKADSPNVGVAFDIANAFAVLCDPNEDIDILAPLAFTSHVKDTRIIDSPFGPDYFPMIPVGCAVGEGCVDIPRAIRLFATRSRYPEGFHLIYEPAWSGKLPEGADPRLFQIDWVHRSVAYLHNLIGTPNP